MDFFLLFLFKLKCLETTLINENLNSTRVIENKGCHLNKLPIKLVTFRLHTSEIDDIKNSFHRVVMILSCMIHHIQNLQYAKKCNRVCNDFLPSLEKLIQDISVKRKNAEIFQVCEYESLKFCELFYYILHYIIKYDIKLFHDFIVFSNKLAKLILELIVSESKNFIFRSRLHSINKIFTSHSIPDTELRRFFLMDFCEKFLEKQHVKFCLSYVKANYSFMDLLSLCINIYVRFEMENALNFNLFYKEFLSQKYSISSQFRDVLYFNGYLTGCIYDARVELKKFLYKNSNSNFEKKLIDQKKIPSVFDIINKHCSSVELQMIDYGKNIQYDRSNFF